MLVRIRNRLSQTITVSVTVGGVVSDINIPAHGTSETVDNGNLTEYTRNLARTGHVKVVPA